MELLFCTNSFAAFSFLLFCKLYAFSYNFQANNLGSALVMLYSQFNENPLSSLHVIILLHIVVVVVVVDVIIIVDLQHLSLCVSVCTPERVSHSVGYHAILSNLCIVCYWCKQLTNLAGWLSVPWPIPGGTTHILYNYLCIGLGTRNLHMRFSSESSAHTLSHFDLSICVLFPVLVRIVSPLYAVIKVSPFYKLMAIYLPTTVSFMHLQNPIKFETTWN